MYIRGPRKQLPWIVTVPLPFIEGIYDTSVHHPDLPSSSLILSIPLKLCRRTVTMFLSLCEHHTSDNTTCTHTSTHHNLHAAIHRGHVCEDRFQTHNPLYILSHAYVNVRSCLSTVQNALVSLLPHRHSPNGPLHSIRQIRRRLRTILQVPLECTLAPTRCIRTFTPSYIIPGCVPPATTYPQPGHVSLGTTSPLLLQSSRLFPVAFVSSPSTLDTSVYLFCTYLKVPIMSFSTKLLHPDMMSEMFFLDQFLRCLLPSCGICFSFLQRILVHQ